MLTTGRRSSPHARWRGPLAACAVVGALSLAGPLAGASAAETTIPNNLSFPVIWGDGVSLTLPGTFDSPQLTTIDTSSGLYLQGVAGNTWQAESATATEPTNVSQLDWGDNLEAKSLSLGKPQRVEITLLQDLAVPMLGFEMKSATGTKNTEVFGTTGQTYESSQATVYSGCARLTIQRLDISRSDPYLSQLSWDPALGQWAGAPHMIAPPVVNSPVWEGGGSSGFSAEINGSGKVIYGYNWQTTNLSAGDYRVTFSLDGNCPAAILNTFITPTTGVYVTPTTETAGITAAAGTGGESSSGGGAPVIDAADNLSYVDVELGTPTYSPYVPVPANTQLPSISGAAVQGSTLTASPGTWDNTPTSYSYQWQLCDVTGTGCTAIAAATGASYTLTGADVGRTVRVLVSAANQTGAATVASLPTAVITAQAPPAAPTNPPQTRTQVRARSQIMLQLHWLTQTRARLSGWVTPRRGGQELMIQRRNRSGWQTVTTTPLRTQTQTRSRYTLTLTLRAGEYRAYLGGDATWAPSASRTMTVRGLVRLTARTRHLAHARLRLTGTATPSHSGERVRIQRRTRAGWRTVTSALLRQAGGRESRYTATLAHVAPGTYRVLLRADRAHRTSYSPTFTVS